MSMFKSLLASYMDGMIAQKHALGYTYEVQKNILIKFDAMLASE